MGKKIDMAAEEFIRMMLLDGCFLLVTLLSLYENVNTTGSPPNDVNTTVSPPNDVNTTVPSPKDDDDKHILQILSDLMLLENQVPFPVLNTLSFNLSSGQQELVSLASLSHDKKLSPKNIAQLLFNCDNVDFSGGVYHFLHFIHLCSPDPYQYVNQENHSKYPIQLKRCATKLRALGISIKASQTSPSTGNNKPGIWASALRRFEDKFEFKIELPKENGEWIIPTLHIKEVTEVKWRNLIAWEQLELIGIGYKFTSYACFFRALVSSVDDIKLLRETEVIKVYTEDSDNHLLNMFQSMIAGVRHLDGRYEEVCLRLNLAQVHGVVGCCWYCRRAFSKKSVRIWRRFLEWLPQAFKNMSYSFNQIYLSTPWKFIGLVAGAATLGLLITQTVYAIRVVKV